MPSTDLRSLAGIRDSAVEQSQVGQAPSPSSTIRANKRCNLMILWSGKRKVGTTSDFSTLASTKSVPYGLNVGDFVGAELRRIVEVGLNPWPEAPALRTRKPPRRYPPGRALVEFVLRSGEGIARKPFFIENDGPGVVLLAQRRPADIARSSSTPDRTSSGAPSRRHAGLEAGEDVGYLEAVGKDHGGAGVARRFT